MASPADEAKHGSHCDICLCVTLPFMSVQGRDTEKGKSTRQVHCFKCVPLVEPITPLSHITDLTRLVVPARELDSGIQTHPPTPNPASRSRSPPPGKATEAVPLVNERLWAAEV